MMAKSWFTKGKDVSQQQVWSDLDPASAEDRIVPLLGLTLASLDAVHAMVLSPGSPESQQFRRTLIELTTLLLDRMPSPDQLRDARAYYLKASTEQGEWQKNSVEAFQKDLQTAVGTLRGMVEQAVGGEDQMLLDMRQTATVLRSAEACDDINQVRQAMRKELEHVLKAVQAHSQAHAALKKQLGTVVNEFERKAETVKNSANSDPVTGCATRAALEFFLLAACRKSQWEGKPYSIAMCDLDDFKGINDKHGHPVGDAALAHFANYLKAKMPPGSFIARYGGDEFVLVGQCDAQTLAKQCDVAIKGLAAAPCTITSAKGELKLILKSSMGVAEVVAGDTGTTVVARADEGLYAAKRAGKNRVACALPPAKAA